MSEILHETEEIVRSDNFKALEAKIQGHAGEPVLVVYEYFGPFGNPGMPRRYYHTHLGILTDDQVRTQSKGDPANPDKRGGRILLPTERYAYQDNWKWYCTGVALGSIALSQYMLTRLDEERFNWYKLRQTKSVDVLVGREQIDAAFADAKTDTDWFDRYFLGELWKILEAEPAPAH